MVDGHLLFKAIDTPPRLPAHVVGLPRHPRDPFDRLIADLAPGSGVATVRDRGAAAALRCKCSWRSEILAAENLHR